MLTVLHELDIFKASDLTKPLQSIKIERLHFNKVKLSIMWSNADIGTLLPGFPLVSFIHFTEAEKFASFRSECRKGLYSEGPSIPTAIPSAVQDSNTSRETISLDEADMERMAFFLKHDYQPYKTAIEQLQKLNSINSMSGKLECMLDAIQETVQCVKEFWQLANNKKDILVYVYCVQFPLIFV
jgi:hypothetical protein